MKNKPRHIIFIIMYNDLPLGSWRLTKIKKLVH
jgi:hypothetical protein